MRNNKRKTDISTFNNELPPSSKDVEAIVLGTILLDSSILHSCINTFQENLFFHEEHSKTCLVMRTLYQENSGIDMLTVIQKARELSLEKVITPLFISGLTSKIVSTINFEHHYRILQEYALRRSIIQSSAKAIRDAFDSTMDVFDVINETQLTIDSSVNSVMSYKISKAGEIHEQIVKQSIQLLDSKQMSGVPSKLRLLDNVTNGWQNSDLIILAGRPGMGKTAAAICFAMYPAIQESIPVGIFSLEMSKEQLVSRMQSILSGVNVSKIVKKQLSVDEINSIREYGKPLAEAPIYIDDTAGLSIMDFKGKARKMVIESKVRLIIVDYLQLMRSGVKTQSRENEISEISRNLKIIAKELNVPIIALSQLSRSVEQRGGDKKPLLSDLRESGQIEQDADMIAFCYRPEYYGFDNYEVGTSHFEAKGLFMLIISKHRNGELGEIPLSFIAEQTKITNYDFTQNNFDNTDINSTFVQREENSEERPISFSNANLQGWSKLNEFESTDKDETPF